VCSTGVARFALFSIGGTLAACRAYAHNNLINVKDLRVACRTVPHHSARSLCSVPNPLVIHIGGTASLASRLLTYDIAKAAR